jgi:hypothetical protein
MKRKIEYWVTYITSEYSECAGEEHCFDKFDTLEDAEEFALNFDNFVKKDIKHIFIRKVLENCIKNNTQILPLKRLKKKSPLLN